MNQELISVIVPVYNVENYLNKCIDSIINQTYSNLEIILIDDGSTDNSGIICDNYKKIDKRIIVVHKNNGGLSSARNIGLDISRGELISFVDSDDYLEQNMLESLKNNMDKYNSNISICDFYYIKNDIKRKSDVVFNKTEFVSSGKDKYKNIQNEYGSIASYAWNKLFKKEIFDDIRYPDGKIYEDSYILCETLDKAKIISYISKPLYNYVYRENSIVNSFGINQFDKIDSYNVRIDFFNKKMYYDLALEEKNRKMNSLIINLSKMKKFRIKDKEIYKKYYKELVTINKEVKWKDSTKYNKFYKVFRRPTISIFACMLNLRDLVK